MNYKVDSRIDLTAAGAIQALNILDTGTGLNLIHEDRVRRLRIAPLGPTKKPLGLNDAAGRALKVKRTTVLTVISGDETLRVPFLLVGRLSKDVILCFDYIERNVEAFLPNRRTIVLQENAKVPIHKITRRELRTSSPVRAKPIKRNPLRHCGRIYAA